MTDGERQFQGSTGDLPEFATLRSVGIDLPAEGARELKVWAHTISPEGDLGNPAGAPGRP